MSPFLRGKRAFAPDLPLPQRLPVLRFPLPGEMFLNNRLEIDDFAHIVPHHRRRREAGPYSAGGVEAKAEKITQASTITQPSMQIAA